MVDGRICPSTCHVRLPSMGYIALDPPTQEVVMSASPPECLPRYRRLTGKDDASFCRRVPEALDMGYVLYGSPAATFNGDHVVVAQAIVWPERD